MSQADALKYLQAIPDGDEGFDLPPGVVQDVHCPLHGVYTGVLLWRDTEAGEDDVVQYPAVLYLVFLKGGTMAGKRFAWAMNGTQLPVATIHRSSSWKTRRFGDQQHYSIRLVLQEQGTRGSYELEGLINPKNRVMSTVTWRTAGSQEEYQTATNFTFRGITVAEAKQAAKNPTAATTPNNTTQPPALNTPSTTLNTRPTKRPMESEPEQAKRPRREMDTPLKPPPQTPGASPCTQPAGPDRRIRLRTETDQSDKGKTPTTEPPRQRQKAVKEVTLRIPTKPPSQTFDQSSATGSLGIFVDETEAARATSYHKVHGKYPPDIQERMLAAGLDRDTVQAGQGLQTWRDIKDAYDKARKKGGDGSLPENERHRRIQEWLDGVVLPSECSDGHEKHNEGQQEGVDTGSAPRTRPNFSSPRGAPAPPPAKPSPQKPLPRPTTLQPPPPPQYQPPSAPSGGGGQGFLTPTYGTPTYGTWGNSPLYGGITCPSPAYANSAMADHGDETPAYGDLLQGESPMRQLPSPAYGGSSPWGMNMPQ